MAWITRIGARIPGEHRLESTAVLVEMNLPKVGGLGILRQIKGVAPLKRIPAWV